MKAIILISLGFIINLSAQNTIIALINKPSNKEIRAKIRTDKTMYVGLTINPDSRNEMNFKVQKVEAGISFVDFDVSEVHEYSNDLKRMVNDASTWSTNNIINEELPYVIAIWEKKVNIVQCTINNVKPCIFCRKNGFHLEGRVDTESAGYNIKGKEEIINSDSYQNSHEDYSRNRGSEIYSIDGYEVDMVEGWKQEKNENSRVIFINVESGNRVLLLKKNYAWFLYAEEKGNIEGPESKKGMSTKAALERASMVMKAWNRYQK